MSAPHPSWSSPSAVPTLREGQVHVWRASLDQARAHLPQWTRTLGDVERSRAERFLLERDRHRFVARHGILREILAGYLAMGADQLRFRYGRHGKPRLVNESGRGALHFNLSHSDRMAVFAFTYGRLVGIDVERVRAGIPWDDIAAQFFTRRENRRLRRLPENERPRAFLVAWTCKEAYVKARGDGLSFPVDRVEVSVSPPALRRVEGDEDEASRWTLQELRVGGDYVAALAVEGDDRRLLCWEWR